LDPSLHKSISLLDEFKLEKHKIQNGPGSQAEKDSAIKSIAINCMGIDDMCLDFTLPGYPDIELVENGKEIMVSILNVDQYIERIIDMSVGSGIKSQIDSFRRGFNRVFPIKDLHCFSIQELLVLLGGEQKEDWSLKGIL
jgi:E3 ubiquitin-protein ligase TRIP12